MEIAVDASHADDAVRRRPERWSGLERVGFAVSFCCHGSDYGTEIA